ncbi:WD40 repeat-like protein [Mollisia scopiformis]|uniref:WD40 repeat-like protein n=1 Tax=Mollisia scopiformis TaxID=149040 RepID=A0A194XM37_MOLSC|nr:WD40 repeat-like protein [Mollisia scopiformis]KUJ21149.1 WD40 repeat-like protein [Mollisia scopiformis]
MSRVFRMEDWAPQEAQNSFSSASDTPNDSFDQGANSRPSFRKRLGSLPLDHSLPTFRKRLQSLPLDSRSTELSEGIQIMSLAGREPAETQVGEENKKVGGIRGLLRKASVSIKNRQRRHSHAVEERPQTAWRRLKTATSFHRGSKFLPPSFDYQEGQVPFDSHQELLFSPIPGNGNAPPIIPRGYGGAAARATAAAQNEYIERNRMFLFPEDQIGENESGIGIAVTMADQVEEFVVETPPGSDISRVDFVGDLPVELAIQILAHLDHGTLRGAARVSKKWAQVTQSQHIWREVFLREQTKTFATGKPLQLGAGLGLPAFEADNDWKDLYRVREQLRRNWKTGVAEATMLIGHLDSIYCVQFDERKIITGSRDKTIRVWDMHTSVCTLVIGPPDVVNNPIVLFDEDGRTQHYAILPHREDERVAESTPATVSFSMYHEQSILCLQYDENILVTGSSDSTCIVYDIKNGYTPIRRLVHHTGAVLDLAFDDRYIVTCSKDASICVWERETGVMLKQLRGHTGPVNAVQLRGNTIVSCSGDFKVKLWNIDTGKNIKELTGHTKGLACSQFSDDSRFIASAGNDKIINIWDANTGENLKSITAHEGLVRSLHIDSISGRLISGSYDQDIKVFDMASGKTILDFPKWHGSWILGAKSDYRRIISTGQIPKVLIMDFGKRIKGIENLESH